MEKWSTLFMGALLCFGVCSCGNTPAESSISESSVDRGTLTIGDIEIIEGTTAIISPTFSKPDYSERLVYTFSGNNILINDKYVTGLVVGTTTKVTAKGLHFETTFEVKVVTEEEYLGTLTIADISLPSGSTVDIVPVFSRPERAEELEYDYFGNDIYISEGKVTGVKEDTITVVEASGENFTCEFTVSVTTSFESKLTKAAYTYVDYWSLMPEFDDNGNKVTYSSTSGAIEINGNKIKGKQEGSALVTATYGSKQKRFSFAIRNQETPDDDSSDKRYLSYKDDQDRLAIVKDGIENFEYDEGELTLVFGDSFTDDRLFLKDFYTTRFGDKNAYTVGVSATRASQWKWWIEDFTKYQPKNIVMHIGTNDLFVGCSLSGIISNVKTIWERIHEESPNTVIYYWTIEQRIGQSYKNADIAYVNEALYAYASTVDYVKVIDTYSIMSNPDGSPNSYLYMQGDTVHPRCPECYDLMFAATEEEGLVVSTNSKAGRISDRVIADSIYMNGSSRAIPLAYDNFYYEGNIKVNSYSSNPHISIEFNYDGNNRFLIWDGNGDGTFNYGGAANGAYWANSKETMVISQGTTFKIGILKIDGNAFMFINDRAQIAFTPVPNPQQNFLMGGCGISYDLTDQVISKPDFNETLYNKYAVDDDVVKFINTSTKIDGTYLSFSNTGISSGIIDMRGGVSAYPMGKDLSADIVGGDGYGGPTRDYYFYYNGSNKFSGDFAVSYDIEYKNHRDNGYVGVNCSAFGSYVIWGEYHLFYQATSPSTPNFKIHSDYGSKCAAPSSTAGATQQASAITYTKLTAIVAKKGSYLYVSYKVNDGGNDVYYTSTNAVSFSDAAVWLSIGNMEAVFSDFDCTFDAAKVASIVDAIDNK